jgi:hypothetical protein
LYGRIHACTDGGFAKALLLHVAALSTAGAFAAAAAALARRRLWGGVLALRGSVVVILLFLLFSVAWSIVRRVSEWIQNRL